MATIQERFKKDLASYVLNSTVTVDGYALKYDRGDNRFYFDIDDVEIFCTPFEDDLNNVCLTVGNDREDSLNPFNNTCVYRELKLASSFIDNLKLYLKVVTSGYKEII